LSSRFFLFVWPQLAANIAKDNITCA